jgi:hypothetical protein
MFETESQTIGSISTEMYRIVKLPNRARQAEAERFMAEYTNWTARETGETIENAHAIVCANIGYLSGYSDSKERKLIQETFQVAHPIFGRA